MLASHKGPWNLVSENRWTEDKEDGGTHQRESGSALGFSYPHHLEAWFLRHLRDQGSRRKKEGKTLCELTGGMHTPFRPGWVSLQSPVVLGGGV